MDGATLPVLLVAIVAVGAAGVYLLLRDGRVGESQSLRRIGGALAGVSLLMLLSSFGMPADWWPQSRLTPTLAFAAWTLLSIASVAAALVAIAMPQVRAAALSFVVMLAANAGLHLFQSQLWLAAGTAACSVIGLAIVWRAPWEAIERLAANRAMGFSREPFLACVAGGILIVAVIGTVRFALVTEAAGIEDRGSKIEGRQGQSTRAQRSGLLGRLSFRESLSDSERRDGLIATVIHDHRIALVLMLALGVTTSAGVNLVLSRARSDARRAETESAEPRSRPSRQQTPSS